MPRALYSSGLPCVPGTRIMSPKAAKITFGLRGDRQTIVDPAHGKDADRASGAVNQFDIFGEQIFQAEAVDSVSVAAANLHDAIMTIGIGEPADFFTGLGDQFRAREIHLRISWLSPRAFDSGPGIA